MDKIPIPEFIKTINPDILTQTFLNTNIPPLTPQVNIQQPKLPPIKSKEEQYKFVTDRMDAMQEELKNQTTELQRLEYENKKLNAQITTQNKVIDKQLSELEEQRGINTNLQKINNTLVENNKHSFHNGILIGLIPSVIILVITVILTYYGWL